jgi:DNA-binding transcriptional LysR family regulator
MRANWHSLREFEAFRAVIAAGTATSAARRLGLSQSAVSRAIAQLESRVGTLFFERQGNRLSPTPEALAFNARLDDLFEAMGRLDKSSWAAESGEPLRVAAPPTFAHRLLARRVASFLALDPTRKLTLEITSSDAIVAGIAEGRHDLALMDIAVSHPGVRVDPFRRSRAVCVLPADHPLAARETIEARDLDGEPFVALTRRHSVRTTLERIFAASGVAPRVVVETSTSLSAWEFARSGVGITVLNPFPVASGPHDGVAVRGFEPKLTYTTAFLHPAATPPSAAAHAFVKHVRLTLGRDAWSSPA